MANGYPEWVRQWVFVIPETLIQRLRFVSDEDRVKLCRIASDVVIKTKKNPVLFKPISTTHFKGTVGGHYKRFVDQLVDWKIIEVNPRYRSTGEKKFCMSYRLTHRAAAVEKRRIWIRKKVVQPLKDHSKLTDDVATFVHRNLKQLGVRRDLLPQANIVDEVEAQQWAEKIYCQKFNLKYSKKVKRMFHSVIVMPRIARRNLVLKDAPTTPLFEYDIKSCHPVLLLALIKDSHERSDYEELLAGDIYSTVARDCGIELDRDDLKVDFLKFANGKAKNYYHAYFIQRFPQLTQRIDNVRKDKAAKEGLAWLCQASEARIMTQIVPRLLMGSGKRETASNSKFNQDPLICGDDSGCFYIPMHDGWLGIETDELRIADVVREDFYKRVGYWVTITKTPVAGGQKATLLQGRLPVAVEQMTRHR